jgi:hypothetical protein
VSHIFRTNKTEAQKERRITVKVLKNIYLKILKNKKNPLLSMSVQSMCVIKFYTLKDV